MISALKILKYILLFKTSDRVVIEINYLEKVWPKVWLKMG